jgi:methenyltetrahydrofolate cyclohydrolase
VTAEPAGTSQTGNQAGPPATADQLVGEWLAAVGSDAPAPGGGAAAAMTASTAAALVEMVCSLTIGKPAFAEYEQHVTQVRDTARELRETALALADHDAAAFTALMAAYRLPRETNEHRAERTAAIQAASLRAATVPLEIAATAAGVAGLAAQLPGRSNPRVLSDVGVAAACADAAIVSAAINVEVNLASLTDAGVRVTLSDRLARHLVAGEQARQLASDVRQELA